MVTEEEEGKAEKGETDHAMAAPACSKHQNSPSNAAWTLLLSVPVRTEPGPEAADDGFVKLIIRWDGTGTKVVSH
ncbi:hypothetical protein CPLU01_09228 [Colletotrichum plurivorum]|uniref:Uncharacterized protein n=1 Tax=Colletotrichum plurivorum TaxID=2175906 RepID=A0A8H6K9C2_9PEZI|nr:hypothetical protein CPLU01_09228 [Colletotrichum plurivorum]